LRKSFARDTVAFGQPHQAALVADQPLVDAVELLDQRVDARLIEPQRLHLGDDLLFQPLVFALLRGEKRGAAEPELDILLLQTAQSLIGVGDVVECFEHLGLELGLDRGERKRVLHFVFVEIALGERLAGRRLLTFGACAGGLELGGARSGRRHLRGRADDR